MTPNDRSQSRYADLLDGRNDPALARLIADLDRFHRPAPPPLPLRARVEHALGARIAEQRHHPAAARRRHLPLWPPHRAGVTAAAVLAVFVLCAAAAPVAFPILEQAFNMRPDTQRIIAENRGTRVNLSQTVNGFTVTIERVYADAHQIIIGYTVSGPPGRAFNNFSLSDRQGRNLPTLTDTRGAELPQALVSWGAGVDVREGKGGYVRVYDGAGVTGAPTEITLRWEVPVLDVYERTAAPIAGASCDGQTCAYNVAGPFAFDFTVPFDPGRVAESHQTVEVGGTPVTLERVVVARTGTRVFLRGAGPNAGVTLSVDGATHTLRSPGAVRSPWDISETFDYVTPAALHDKRGEWVLVVTAGHRQSDTLVQGGPWTFRFVVP